MAEEFTWKISVIVQQDGESCFEFTELEDAILSQKQSKAITYKMFFYSQGTGMASIKTVDYSKEGKAFFREEGRSFKANLYDSKVLTKFLKDYVWPNETKNERHMIITFGHGAGLGFFSYLEPDPNNNKDTSNKVNFFSGEENLDISDAYLEAINDDLNFFTFLIANLSLPAPNFDSLPDLLTAKDFTSSKSVISRILRKLNLISAQQLAQIIGEGLGKPVDFLITINCYTQMLDVGYELKDVVRFLASAETRIPFTGINYCKLLEKMVEMPDLSEDYISNNIIENFKCKYENQPFKDNYERRYSGRRPVSIDLVALSVNRLEEYKSLVEKLNPVLEDLIKLNSMILSDGKELKFKINDARSVCGDLSKDDTHEIIDLLHFLDEIIKRIPEPEQKTIRSKYDEFVKQHTNCIIKFLKPIGPPDPYIPQPLGMDSVSDSPNYLSVFFPSGKTNEIAMNLLKMYFNPSDLKPNNQFQKDCLWQKFISLFAKVGQDSST
jgi:hypothetical protein